MSDGDTARKTNSALPSEDQVSAFLAARPDFLTHQPHLLEAMELPHATGKAVSLIERQVSVLRDRNMDLRRRLHQLLDSARSNDQLLEKSQRLILALLETNDLVELLKVLSTALGKDFQVQFHSVVLFRDVPAINDGELHKHHVKIVPAEEAMDRIGPLLSGNRPLCGILRVEELIFLFGADADKIGSVATAPLGKGEVIGVLAIGHADPDYYRSSTGTLFLTYVAEVLNRTLPRLLN